LSRRLVAGALVALASCGGGHAGPPGDPSPLSVKITALPDAATAAPASFVLTEVKGDVQLAEGADFHPAPPGGGAIEGRTRIRTGPHASAVLRAPDGSEIALADSVDISVEELSPTGARFALARGKVHAASPGSRRITVDSSGSHTEANDARFTVYTSRAGLVAVASESGKVKVSAQHREVQVGAGQQSIVPPHRPPSDPVPVPDEVFLRVDWPGETLKREPETLVRGHARPGERVFVNRVETDVSVDGTFVAKVHLKEGKNPPLEVEAEAMDGKRRKLHGPQLEIRTNLNVEVKPVEWGTPKTTSPQREGRP
jgi:FecR protein